MGARNGTVEITERVFTMVKMMLNGGASRRQISDCTGVSKTSVSNINGCETYDDYLEFRKKKAAQVAGYEMRKREEREEPIALPVETRVIHEQSVTIQATHYMMEELKKTNELLTAISNKVAFIVDELTK